MTDMVTVPESVSRALAARNVIVRRTGECTISLEVIHEAIEAAAPPAQPVDEAALLEDVARAMCDGEYALSSIEFPPWEKRNKTYWRRIAGFALAAMSRPRAPAPQDATLKVIEAWDYWVDKRFAENNEGDRFAKLTEAIRELAALSSRPTPATEIATGWHCGVCGRDIPKEFTAAERKQFISFAAATEPATVSDAEVEAARDVVMEGQRWEMCSTETMRVALEAAAKVR